MRKSYRGLRQVALLIVLGIVGPGSGWAGDLTVVPGRSSSVAVVKADAARHGDGEISVSGLLRRYHRLPMTGHLHVYGYAKTGELIAQSRHRIPALNSQKKGAAFVPFRIFIEFVPEETGRIFLRYHGPGRPEPDFDS